MADRSWRSGSLRAKITLTACAVVAPTLVLGGILFLRGLRSSLISREDAVVAGIARNLAEQVTLGDVDPFIATPNDDTFAQIVDPDGRPIAASTELEGKPPIIVLDPTGRHDPEQSLRLDIDPDDPFRVHTLVIRTDGGPVVIFTGYSLSRVQETVTSARRILYLGAPALLLIVGAMCWRAVDRALRPVDLMRLEVADISARDLGRRVAEPASADEIARLAATMNAMLDRLQYSADQQRQFVSNASHELRSPLAASRADIEVALAHPADTDVRRTLQTLLADNDRMTALIDDLLFLARGDEGDLQPPGTLLDLDDHVRDEAGHLQRRTDVPIDLATVEPAVVRANADQINRVIANLLDNAVRHARSRVTVSLTTTGEEARLTVDDDGPGVPEHLRERIFERFGRADGSRSRQSGGTGLGLAIVREIAGAHGGSIDLEPSPAGARFVLRLPAENPDAPEIPEDP